MDTVRRNQRLFTRHPKEAALTMKTRVGVLGASSFVADFLIPRLRENYEITTFSRSWPSSATHSDRTLLPPIRYWISLMPIAALPARLGAISELGARRIVALSSTSVFTKAASSEPSERLLSQRIRESEQRLLHGLRASQWNGSSFGQPRFMDEGVTGTSVKSPALFVGSAFSR